MFDSHHLFESSHPNFEDSYHSFNGFTPEINDDDVFYLFLQKQKTAQSYIPQGYFQPYEAV